MKNSRLLLSILLWLLSYETQAKKVSFPFQSQDLAQDRIKILNNHFQPQIGKNIKLDPRQLQNAQGTMDYLDVRGYIQINPPPKQCFTITRRISLPDVKVCKPTSLWFDLSDLHEDGTLHWSISTGENDFGTELVWQSDIRFLRFIPMTKKMEDGSERMPIGSCEIMKTPLLDRRIKVTLLDARVWIFVFPKTDLPVTQRKPPPNLYILKIDDFTWAESLKNKPSEAKEGGEDKKKPKLSPEEERRLEEESIAKSDDTKLQTAYSKWSISHRGSYVMDSSGFIIDGKSMPSGSSSNSECWYRYEINPKTQTGELECHEVGIYRFVYLPLTCLAKLDPASESNRNNH